MWRRAAPFLQVGGVSCAGIAIYRALYLNGEPRATCTYKQHKYKHRWIWTANVHTRGLKPLYTGEKCVPKVYIEGAESTVEKLQSILFEIAPLGIKDTTLGIVPTQLDSYGYAPIEVQTDDEKDIRRIEHFLATKDVTLCFRSKHWPLSREWVPFFYFHKTHYVNLIDKRFYTCNGMERSLNNR